MFVPKTLQGDSCLTLTLSQGRNSPVLAVLVHWTSCFAFRSLRCLIYTVEVTLALLAGLSARRMSVKPPHLVELYMHSPPFWHCVADTVTLMMDSSCWHAPPWAMFIAKFAGDVILQSPLSRPC